MRPNLLFNLGDCGDKRLRGDTLMTSVRKLKFKRRLNHIWRILMNSVLSNADAHLYTLHSDLTWKADSLTLAKTQNSQRERNAQPLATPPTCRLYSFFFFFFKSPEETLSSFRPPQVFSPREKLLSFLSPPPNPTKPGPLFSFLLPSFLSLSLSFLSSALEKLIGVDSLKKKK